MHTFNTEAELIDALKQGEKRACADLVERFSSQVYRVALRLMDDPGDAEDVLQETLVEGKNVGQVVSLDLPCTLFG